MKVIKVAEAADVERGIAAYAAVADRLMFDAADGILPGGNAKAFDWTILSGRTVPLPWLLAGGLTPDNVAEAVRVTGARAVDVSSAFQSRREIDRVDQPSSSGRGPLRLLMTKIGDWDRGRLCCA